MVYSPVHGIFSLSGQIFSAGNSLVLLSTSAYKREAQFKEKGEAN